MTGTARSTNGALRALRARLAVAACLGAAALRALAADTPEIRVGSERDFRPYAFVDETGQPAGFSVDLIRAVADAMGLRLRVSAGTWPDVWEGLVAGELDALPIVARLPDREALVDFSLPHTETYDAFFVRKGDPILPSIAAASGRAIVVMRSDAAHHALLERDFSGTLIPVETIPEGLSLVASGRHDAFLCSKLIGTLEMRAHRIKGLRAGTPLPDYKRVFAFAVRKGNTGLLEELNQGLLILKTNGEYDRIYEKWLTADDPWRRLRTRVLPAAAVACGAALVLAGWLLVLRRQVRHRTRELAAKNAQLTQARQTLEESVSKRTAELARALDDLRESQTRLAAFAAATVEGIVESESGRIVDCNAQCARMLGCTVAELKGTPIADMVAPEDRERVAACVVRNDESVIEHAALRRDGTRLIVEAHGRAVAPGSPRRFTTLRDITERKRAEEALRASEHTFSAIFHSNAAAMALTRLEDGCILDANDAWLQLTGFGREAAIGKAAAEHGIWKNPADRARFVTELRTSGSVRDFEIPCVRGTGNEFTALLSAQTITLRGETVVLSSAIDISARKRAEEALRESESRIRKTAADLQAANTSLIESRRAALNLMDDARAAQRRAEALGVQLRVREEQLRLFVEYAPASIAMFDTGMRYLAASRRWLADYGLTGQSLAGRNHYDVLPDVPERWREIHRRCLAGEVLSAEEDPFDRADGTRQWIRWEIRPWNSAPNTIGGIIIFSEDVTERKQAQEELRAAHARAEWLARFPQENPEPVLRVTTDGAVLYANPAALDRRAWTGPKGRTLAAPLLAALKRAVAGRTSLEEDVTLGDRTYALALALFPEEGYANLYGRDITERKRAESAIVRAKQEWERTFDTVPDLIAILDEQHRVVRANRAMAEKLGREPAQCIGLSCFSVVHGCDAPPELCPHALTLRDGAEHSAEVHEERLGGDFLVTTTPLKDADGRMVGAVHVARDITERKRREQQLQRLNRALNALSRSSQAIARATDETDFMDTACRIIAQDCGYAMVWIGLAQDDAAKSIRPAAFAGFDAGYLETLQLTWADTERGRGPTGTAVRTGQVCRCLDMLADPRFLPWRAEAVKRGYASSIALPLMGPGGAFGALTICAREPVGFIDAEVELLTELATDFAQGITALRTRAARERAEQAVRESEERYRTLFNTMTEGFSLHQVICDAAGEPRDYRFIDINPAFERLTGLTRESVVGKTVLEVLPETEPIWIERFGRVALTGEPDHFTHFSAALGRHYDVNVCRTAPGRFAVIFTDVTEMMALQQREKEDAIRLAWGQSAIDTVNAMREGVALLETDGTITSVNPAIENLTGLAGGDLVGRNLDTVIPRLLAGTDLASARHGLEILRKGDVPNLPPLVLRRLDQRVFHVLPSVSLMDAPEGGRRVAVLTLKDVTELHEAAQRLEQNERKYRELVENANSIIMRIKPDHTITFFNEYAQAFFGYAAGEILGRNVLGTIVREVDSQGHDMRGMMRGISEHPELHGSNENENVCRDGRLVWVHWSNRAIRDETGRVTEILCVGTDITRRREAEEEARRYQRKLRELTERLAVAEEEDRWRISRYIHDTIIQNLSLSSIRLGSMVKPLGDAKLKDEADKVTKVRTLIDSAIDECRMVMSDLTPALLYELGLMPALNDLARQLEEKHGARIAIDDDGAEMTLSHPLRGLLFESTRELIMNALKYAGPCEIRVTVSRRDREFTIRVSDNGKGFSPAVADSRPDRQGGFGLFNIRQRLEGLGGRLDIRSAEGQGTTASITVPMGAGVATAPP